MQPFDWKSELEADHAARLARESITDESLREAGHKEIYPGYFEEDPRHPGWDVRDRYLMDHPGPDWKAKPASIRGVDDRLPNHRFDGTTDPVYRPKRLVPAQDGLPPEYEPAWDDDQIRGQSLEAWQPKPSSSLPPPTKRLFQRPASKMHGQSGGTVLLEIEEPAPTKYSAIWLCQICSKKPALWPTERYWRRSWFGILVTLVFRSPVACTDCRVFNQPATHTVDLWGRRPFWQKVISFWEEPRLLRRCIRHKARQTWKRAALWVTGA